MTQDQLNPSFYSQETPHSLHSRSSYGVSVVCIYWENLLHYNDTALYLYWDDLMDSSLINPLNGHKADINTNKAVYRADCKNENHAGKWEAYCEYLTHWGPIN